MSEFASLVDHTRFDLVRRLVNQSASPVTDVLFVESDQLMCEMAEVLTGPNTMARRLRLQCWFEEGRVTAGTTAAPPGKSPTCCLDVHSIDRETLCHVLFLPPYYLVYLAGGHASSLPVVVKG